MQQPFVRPARKWAPEEFRKSSFSPTSNADCVQVARRPSADVVAVRDSKQPFRAPILEFAGSGWQALTRHLRTTHA